MICGLLTTLFVCCETPDISDDEEAEESQGNLKVSIYQIEQTPFSALTRAETGIACSRLNFIIYDEEGVRVKQVPQQYPSANFGTASFLLPDGDYQLVVLGHSSNGNPKSTDIKKIGFTNAQGFTDTFLYYSKISVRDEPEDLEVTLKRVVSLCRFEITDDYPADVTKLEFNYTGGSGTLDATTGFGSVKSTQIVSFDVTSGQKHFDLYTFLHDTEGTIHLKVTALDDDDNEIYKIERLEIPMKQNQVTWMTGALFTGGTTGSTDITIVINTDWEGETHLTF